MIPNNGLKFLRTFIAIQKLQNILPIFMKLVSVAEFNGLRIIEQSHSNTIQDF